MIDFVFKKWVFLSLQKDTDTMDSKPNILITNDDGIHAPGIRHLWNALKDLANISIIAPVQEQSAVGVGITIRHPLHIHQVTWPESTKAWSVTGTPADCVKLAMSVILDKKPHLIVSGVNRGSNAGRNILYSGTVGSVIEGLFQDIPGIAFSCLDFFDTNYQKIEKYIPRIVNYVLKHPLPTGTLLNVNFPEGKHEIQGVKLARQGKEMWVEDPHKRSHPLENHSYYWLGAKLRQFEEHEDSDIAWLSKGYVTAVPVHVNELTDLLHLNSVKDHFEEQLNINKA